MPPECVREDSPFCARGVRRPAGLVNSDEAPLVVTPALVMRTRRDLNHQRTAYFARGNLWNEQTGGIDFRPGYKIRLDRFCERSIE